MIVNNLYEIAKSLESKYYPHNLDFSLIKNGSNFLSECIIPTNIVALSGNGATLHTNKGRLIDLASMTVNCILGQNDPWVNVNLIAYLFSNRPSFLTTKLGSEYYYKVARRILDVTGFKNGVINHRQCNGTDVTELAVLAAYKHRRKGQNILISFKNSYHGQGLSAYIMSGLLIKNRFLIKEAPPVIFLDAPTNSYHIDKDEMTKSDKKTLQKLYEISSKVFAVIIEPIQVNNSVNTPSKAFIKELEQICKDTRIALIFDEVQTGFGWLGKMTAAERYGVSPNLITLSKAITAGNGPLSVLISDATYQDIKENEGAKTNGADIRSLVASNAVMDRLLGIPDDQIPSCLPNNLKKELKTGLISTFSYKSNLLYSYLKKLLYNSKGLITNIKGDGLIRGLDIVDKERKPNVELTKKIQTKLLDNGVFVRSSKSTLIIKPPIVITETELKISFNIMEKVLSNFS